MTAFAFLGGGSLDSRDTASYVLVALVFIAIVGIISVKMFTSEENAVKYEQQRIIKQKNEESYNKAVQASTEEFGVPDKTIIIEEFDFDSEIRVYETSRLVFIQGNQFHFEDVMSCTYSDTPRTIKGKTTAITKSSNGSTLGRAIIGGVIAGPAGAIIGGTTSKKDTEFFQENDTVEHDYIVIITVNSISSPVIRIHTGQRSDLTSEIVSLMNVIISRK